MPIDLCNSIESQISPLAILWCYYLRHALKSSEASFPCWSRGVPQVSCFHRHAALGLQIVIRLCHSWSYAILLAIADYEPTHRPVAAQSANYATLREIEQRLKSIKNIEKITKTMKIVASTKLTRAQRAMTESRSYGETSNTVFEKAETKPLENEDKKSLVVVVSSDKGLCGGIHSGLSRYTRRLLQNKPNVDLVVVGEKSKAQLSRSNGKNIVLSFAGVGKDVPTFADAQAIADQISLLPTEYANVQIIYNKFINATSYEATPIEAFSEEAIANSRKS